MNLIFRTFLPIKAIVDKLDYDYEMKWYDYEEIIDVPAGIIISNREFGLVITSKEAKKKGKNLAYIADKDKLKKIYDLLGI